MADVEKKIVTLFRLTEEEKKMLCQQRQDRQETLDTANASAPDRREHLPTTQTSAVSVSKSEDKNAESKGDMWIVLLFMLFVLAVAAGSIYLIICQAQGTAFSELWLMPMGLLTMLAICGGLGLSLSFADDMFKKDKDGAYIVATIIVGILLAVIGWAVILLANGITAGILALIH